MKNGTNGRNKAEHIFALVAEHQNLTAEHDRIHERISAIEDELVGGQQGPTIEPNKPRAAKSKTKARTKTDHVLACVADRGGQRMDYKATAREVWGNDRSETIMSLHGVLRRLATQGKIKYIDVGRWKAL